MNTILKIVLLLLSLQQLASAKRELEIGVISFEESAGAQVKNQLVRFDVSFTKLPKVAIALIDHTPTSALFAKVNNITQNDFIIQFFSAVTVNASYRYIATTDHQIYMNCSNFKASSPHIIKYNEFVSSGSVFVFLTGYHHAGHLNVAVAKHDTTSATLSVDTNDIKQTAVGVCLIVGENVSQYSQTNGPSFNGRVSSNGDAISITFQDKKEGMNIILLIEVQQQSEPTKLLVDQSLDALKTYIDDEITLPKQKNNLRQNKAPENQIIDEQDKFTKEELEEDTDFNEENYCEDTETDEMPENSEDLGEEEDDDDYFENQNEVKKQSSIDFELQLSLLQDALKKKNANNFQQQQAIKQMITINPKESKKHDKKQEQKKQLQKQIIIANETILQTVEEVKQPLNNEEIDIQLHQKEQHLTSLKKALTLIDTFQEKKLEVVETIMEKESKLDVDGETDSTTQDESPYQPTGYMSPLIDYIPKAVEIVEEKQKDKKITQKLDGYMQSFSEDNYVKKIEKRNPKVVDELKEITQKEQSSADSQLIQLTGQSHPTKVVYEASEDSLKKFEEDFERRKQQKMIEIKQQLIPENKPSKAKFFSLAQEDESLKSYKDFFYN